MTPREQFQGVLNMTQAKDSRLSVERLQECLAALKKGLSEENVDSIAGSLRLLLDGLTEAQNIAPAYRECEETLRLSIQLSNEAHQQLTSLCEKVQAGSLVEVFRRALAVYDFLWEQKDDGATIVIKGRNGEKNLVLL